MFGTLAEMPRGVDTAGVAGTELSKAVSLQPTCQPEFIHVGKGFPGARDSELQCINPLFGLHLLLIHW